ncbi:hypothetical protein [Stenotrophomonas maltophilia]|uniref:hypothetical protein n=1 Tax=Stenotrophomonas maltophilia TaxID=40324 RepID=UPI000B263E42|nr:hypothetical protein [Stenotrophomonas maltophilia]MCU1022367.1 hypothetical protein [Stenotrophomonas maltophilia]
MSLWKGVFRCDRLGIDDCVVWWDAVAAFASVATGIVAVVALVVAYRGVVQPYRQWMHDRMEREDEVVAEVKFLLLEFNLFLIENKIGTARIRRELGSSRVIRELVEEFGGDCMIDMSTFPAIPAIEPLRPLRLQLVKLSVASMMLNRLFEQLLAGGKQSMPNEDLHALVVRRVTDLVKYRNAFVEQAEQLIGVPGTFASALESVQ